MMGEGRLGKEVEVTPSWIRAEGTQPSPHPRKLATAVKTMTNTCEGRTSTRTLGSLHSPVLTQHVVHGPSKPLRRSSLWWSKTSSHIMYCVFVSGTATLINALGRGARADTG
jgi:hypothetical protein